MEWEMRPGGMQRSQAPADDGGYMMTITVAHSASQYDIFLPKDSTFGVVKRILGYRTGLRPVEQQLFFGGKEKENEKSLYAEGVREKSKLLLLEKASSEERKLEEIRKHNEMLKASEAVAEVRLEVDKIAERVSVLEVAVDGRTRLSDKEFLMSTELLMRQLLKLDGIEAEGEVKLQRKAEVRRVQNIVDTLDSLKSINSNPFTTIGEAAKWEA